ncbi:type VII toxin-antitoxin system MntA family adenylyltransferase antitoxin [Parendozoicomonas haliclonae]|uniref:Nucleotidyltransferase domain protein n=1 Tax=Parendozoicomonas haliclonae TaxID=1960125 RepID=A0A1X7AMX1_9GAMM|nr:nucleotidyltransferase domain-containing protein [Parendozoicomonas haliclonae]SMA49374.1 Nucleotidyltransferase domain protein [Parendozoicomonas haliclonae]
MDNQEALTIVVSKIQSHFGAQLQGVLLYGSRAKGNSRPGSDYDIAILCDQNIPASECWRLAQDIAATLNQDVDLIDLWQATTVLRKEVVVYGVWLYQRDRVQCEEFVTHTLSQYQNLNVERRDLLAAIENDIRNSTKGNNADG